MPLDDAELSRRLDEMPVMEPPADLRTSIMDGVRGSQLTVRSFPRRRAIFAAGWAAAAILVLVFLVAFPLRHEPADVVGTMAPKWPLVDRYGNERATLIVHKRGDFYALEAVIPGARPVTTSIAWDEQKLAPTGVSLGFDASFRKDQVTFTLRDPSQNAGVIVRRLGAATRANVRVSIDNQEVLRAAVPLE